MRSARAWLAGVLAASVILSSAAGAAESVYLGEAVVRLGPPGPPSVVQAPAGYSAKRATATFIVTYVGFTATAKAAFQRAVDIWATQVASPVPIRVHAQWANLGNTGILGSAGPFFSSCPSSCPARVVANTWYPVPLLSKLSGHDVATGDDINAQFNNTFPNWFYGAGAAPAGKVDFTSVVLHELGHGLGFIGSGKLVAGGTQGTVRGLTTSPRRLTIYDRFTVNAANTSLFTFPDPSLALKNQLQSNNLFFRLTTGSQPRFRLFAPATFQPGSSYSHLNEATYPKGNPNSLMTPSISAGETIRSPGPVTLAIFRAMGWN